MDIEIGDIVQIDVDLIPKDVMDRIKTQNINPHVHTYLTTHRLFKAEIAGLNILWQTVTLWFSEHNNLIFDFPINESYMTVVGNPKKAELCDCGAKKVFGKGTTHSHWCSAMKRGK